MKALYLDSVDVDERFLPPAEDDEHREDRESYLRLYQVGDGERVRIRPVIPEVWFGLDTYLSKMGCPPRVVEAVAKRAREVLGPRGMTEQLTAGIYEREYLAVYLIDEAGKITRIQISFLEETDDEKLA